MNLSTAAERVESALSRLEQTLGETVFDEWAVVEKTAEGMKLARYAGNREDDFHAEFANDVAALRETLDLNALHVGDFAFSHEGFGSGFDAHVCAGENLLILFNNTEKSTGEITANPKWTAAQAYFAELVEAFIADPLAL